MATEAVAEIVLVSGADRKPSPQSSFGFIVTIGSESWSAAVVGDHDPIVEGIPVRVNLSFLADEAAEHVIPGREFQFFDEGRGGTGRILAVDGTA